MESCVLHVGVYKKAGDKTMKIAEMINKNNFLSSGLAWNSCNFTEWSLASHAWVKILPGLFIEILKG